MNIGVDCQPLQTPGLRDRGIGRYTWSVLRELLSEPSDRYQLYFNDFFEVPPKLPGGRADIHITNYLHPAGTEENRIANEYLQRLAYDNGDLDIFHATNPMLNSFSVLDSALTDRRFPVVCTLYDLIPLVFP